jgi:hypothetical protein
MLNLLVIRTENPEKLKSQYEQLGFTFNFHKHGNGPLHYSASINSFVFEIYPLTKSMEKADNSIRLGFDIENLESKLEEIRKTNWVIVSEMQETKWGICSIIQDLDGRKVELKQK